MASKQPFKLFDWKQKLKRFYLRSSKTISHKVLSKARNALLLKSSLAADEAITQNFANKLKKNLRRTWDIYE